MLKISNTINHNFVDESVKTERIVTKQEYKYLLLNLFSISFAIVIVLKILDIGTLEQKKRDY